MKVYFDTEFSGLHQHTTLISIGLISENGKEFYAEFTDYNTYQIDDWIKYNVINNLWVNQVIKYGYTQYKPNVNIARGDTKLIRMSLQDWLKQFDTVEWVSDVSHYDFVLLIHLLYGNALKVPSNICSACHDINQDISRFYNISEIEAFNKSREEILDDYGVIITGKKHNSLYDAKVIKAIYENITDMSPYIGHWDKY